MTRPCDAVRAAVRRALQALPEDSLLTRPPLGLVGCSGGADSLALAAGALQAGRQAGWRIGAVVVDHQLQADSAAVSARAAAACRHLGLDPVVTQAVQVGADGGPEGAARAARYQAFGAIASGTRASALLVGHTLDDQAETVLLGLARGSGARSLAGMPAATMLPDGTGVALLRPLLGLTRAQTAAACAAWGLQPWQDPHNGDRSFTRVRVRRDVLPALAAALGPGVAQALARTADLLRQDDELLSQLAEGLVDDLLREAAAAIGVSCALLAEQPAALRRRALRLLALRAGVPAAGLTASHTIALDELVCHPRQGAEVRLPGGVDARARYGRLELARRQE